LRSLFFSCVRLFAPGLMGPGESLVLAEKLLGLPALAAQHAGLKVVRGLKKQGAGSSGAAGAASAGAGVKFAKVPAEFLAQLKDKLSGSGDLLVKQLVGLKVRDNKNASR